MDKTREEFEETGFFGYGKLWVKWDGRKYIKECNGRNKTADSWVDTCNRELSIYEAGFKSRDAEIEKLNQDCKNLVEVNNNQSKIVDSQAAEIKELREALELIREGCYRHISSAQCIAQKALKESK